MADISLSAGIRSNLLSLQGTSSLLGRTQERLGTGRKVNSAIDNPSNYFTAESLNNRAGDLSSRLDGITKGIQTIKAADTGIKGITTFIGQLKGIVNDALGTSSTTDRQTLQSRYNDVINQISQLAEDSGYDGVNLLGSGSLTVEFSEKAGDASLGVTGFSGNATAADLAIGTQGAGFTDNGALTTALTALEAATSKLRTKSRELSTNLSILTTRQDFTKNLVNTLQSGSDKLTLADLNEEGANLLALNTQNSLAVQSLSLSSQAAASVLRIIG
ncbi:MAG: flagellin [Verrucomicrobiota bacterium]|nr:flagellin [Verrucomicrobiota bacterium]